MLGFGVAGSIRPGPVMLGFGVAGSIRPGPVMLGFGVAGSIRPGPVMLGFGAAGSIRPGPVMLGFGAAGSIRPGPITPGPVVGGENDVGAAPPDWTPPPRFFALRLGKRRFRFCTGSTVSGCGGTSNDLGSSTAKPASAQSLSAR